LDRTLVPLAFETAGFTVAFPLYGAVFEAIFETVTAEAADAVDAPTPTVTRARQTVSREIHRRRTG